jgi:hypothetical protein
LSKNISKLSNIEIESPLSDNKSKDYYSYDVGPASRLTSPLLVKIPSALPRSLSNMDSPSAKNSNYGSDEFGPISPLKEVGASPYSGLIDPYAPSAPDESLIDPYAPSAPDISLMESSSSPPAAHYYERNSNSGPMSPLELPSHFSHISPLEYTSALRTQPSIYVRNASAVQPKVVSVQAYPFNPAAVPAVNATPLRLESPLGMPSQGVAAIPVQSLEGMPREDKIRASEALSVLGDNALYSQTDLYPQCANFNANIDIDEAVRLEALNPGAYIPLDLRQLIWWPDDDGTIKSLGRTEKIESSDSLAFEALHGAIVNLEIKKAGQVDKLLQESAGNGGSYLANRNKKSREEIFTSATKLAAEQLGKELINGRSKLDSAGDGVRRLVSNSYEKSTEELSDEERAKIMGGFASIGAYKIGKEFEKNVVNEPGLSKSSDIIKLQKQLSADKRKAAIDTKADLILVTDFFKDVALLPVGFATGVLELLNEGNPNNKEWLNNVIDVMKAFSWLLKIPFDQVKKSLNRQIDAYIDAHVPEGQRAGMKKQIKADLNKAMEATPGVKSYSSSSAREASAKIQERLHQNYRNANIGLAYPS